MKTKNQGEFTIFPAGPVWQIGVKSLDGLLFSTTEYGVTEATVAEARKLIAELQPRHVIIDSGGFSILQAEEKGRQITHDESRPATTKGRVNIAPWHVIDFAQNLKPTFVVALDYPIRKVSDEQQQEKEFSQKLDTNIRWAKETNRLRKTYCNDVKLLLPVQCYTLPQFDRFWERVGGSSFDGVCMPVRNMSVGRIAEFLSLFDRLGVRAVHLLGTTAFFTLALAAYAARHVFDWVSVDSATWFWQRSEYLNPENLLRRDFEGHTALSCTCPSCKGHTLSSLGTLDWKERNQLLWNHNVLAIQKMGERLYRKAYDFDTLLEYVSKTRPKDQKKRNDLQEALKLLDFPPQKLYHAA